jgi:hypothetical protein
MPFRPCYPSVGLLRYPDLSQILASDLDYPSFVYTGERTDAALLFVTLADANLFP